MTGWCRLLRGARSRRLSSQFTASQATLVLDATVLLRWMVNEPGEPAAIVTPRTYRPVTFPWIVARTKLAEVSVKAWVTCDLPGVTVTTPLRENAASPSTLSAAPPPVFWARTPTPCEELATPKTPVVPLPSTPVPLVTFPNTPMPPCEVPYTPQPSPAWEPCTPIPLLPVPSFLPSTAAERAPGLALVISPVTAAAPAAELSVEPETPIPVRLVP